MTQALSRSGLQKPGNGMLLISGSSASSLLSPSQGAVVAPKWVALLPSKAHSSFSDTFFPLLVQKFGAALESAALRDLIPDDTVIQFDFPQSMNDSSMPLRDLSFLALDPLAAAFSGMQTGSDSCRLPLRLVFHGEEKSLWPNFGFSLFKTTVTHRSSVPAINCGLAMEPVVFW